MRIALVWINLHSLAVDDVSSFHARNCIKNFCEEPRERIMHLNHWSEAKHPFLWRIAAGILDISLFSVLAYVASVYWAPWVFEKTLTTWLPLGMAALFSWLTGALGLSLIGTTFGKSLIGIRMVGADLQKLSYPQALKVLLIPSGMKVLVKRGARLRRLLILAFLVYGGFEARDFFTTKTESIFAEKIAEAETAEWHLYQDSFKAQFPSPPTAQTTSLPIPGSTMALPYHEVTATSPEGKFTFAISHTTLPHSWLKWPKGFVLKGALKYIAKHTGAHIHATSSKSYKSYPTLEFRLKRGEILAAGKLILIGAELYKMEVTYPPQSEQAVEDAMARFFSSFEPQ